MKKLVLLFIVLTTLQVEAQVLPHGFAPGEENAMPAYLQSRGIVNQGTAITTPLDCR